jgi:type I restriction enzyme S subunit
MNKIEELINQLCPEGVEFKSIKELCIITRGRVMSKDYLRDNQGIYPVYSSQTANKGVFGKINTFDYDCESVTWTTDGAHAGSVFYHNNEKFSITNVCGLLRVMNNNLIITKYLYYILGTTTKKYVSSGMGNPKLMSNAMSIIKIPIPPLPIQKEIVAILDKFTQLEAELEAELEARKTQYEHYREKLLTFPELRSENGELGIENREWRIENEIRRVEWKTLGEIANIYDGTHQTPTYTNNGVKFVSVENINALSKSKKYISLDDYKRLYKIQPKINDVFMTRIGNIGTCSVVKSNEPLAYYVTLALIRPNEKILNSKFLRFIIESSIGRRELYKRTLVTAVPIKINLGEIGKVKIPIPPLEEQERIVAILDKFDALVNDISVGLPAEIEARRKQYEYYREKLLTFPELRMENGEWRMEK